MEIEIIKKLINDLVLKDVNRKNKIIESEKYYDNENDILKKIELASKKNKDESDNPLKNADNRISQPWHALLVDQKASYTMTVPPTFDVDNKELNDEIVKLLGDKYPKIAKDLAIDASNSGVAWLHIWKDENNRNFFRYSIVDTKQIIPIYSKKLDDELEGLLRVYEDYDDNGDIIQFFEYWNDKEVSTFYKKKEQKTDDIDVYNYFDVIDNASGEATGDKTNTYKHEWGKIPFIPFRNNPSGKLDLKNYKSLIDVYDKVYSGFVNDLDDIQEIIFVLTNYSGQDKEEFLSDLKHYKMIQVEDDGGGAKGGVNTLAIDIPVEARDKILKITREAIFIHGQGVDPQKDIGNNNSGVALKYMYSLLEMKASAMETEFRLGFAELVRFILTYSGYDANVIIKQTWTRTSVNNSAELADIVSKLAPVTSEENIAKSNPLVENWQNEVELRKKSQMEERRMWNDYQDEETNATKKKVADDDEEEV